MNKSVHRVIVYVTFVIVSIVLLKRTGLNNSSLIEATILCMHLTVIAIALGAIIGLGSTKGTGAALDAASRNINAMLINVPTPFLLGWLFWQTPAFFGS